MFPLKKKPDPIGSEALDPSGMDDQGGMDSSAIDDIMSPSPEEGTDGLFGGENKLESALTQAGYVATPEQLSQIESILKPVAATKPPMGGVKPPMGGAVPSAMGSGDLPNL